LLPESSQCKVFWKFGSVPMVFTVTVLLTVTPSDRRP
jgi:hypothetical protein